MSLTVADVLSLEAFNHFRLIAGQKGLKREIRIVGMLDYELNEMIEQNFKEGEFVVTTLVGIKDDLSQLEEMVSRLIKVRAAGFAIKTIYISDVPQAVLDLCEREAFPLFLFEETFFEVIITAVNDVLKVQMEIDDLEIQIDRLISGDMNKYGIRRAAQMIHRSFLEYVQVVYVKLENEGHSQFMSLDYANLLGRHHKCLPYKGGYLLIVTATQRDDSQLSQEMQHTLRQLGITEVGTSGYSHLGVRIDRLEVAIQEALYAFETARRYQLKTLAFPEMGTDRLLLPLKDNPWVTSYYESVMEPIMTYDQKNGTDLLKTAVVYILSDGDIKLAAERLFQHGNTVRYRMERIRQLLSGEDHALSVSSERSFYEMLAIGVRLHLIYTDSL